MPLDLPDLYTLDDLVDRYGLSKDTLYDLVRSGELRGFKIGRAWHVDPDDWRAFIAARRGGDGVVDAPTTPPAAAGDGVRSDRSSPAAVRP